MQLWVGEHGDHEGNSAQGMGPGDGVYQPGCNAESAEGHLVPDDGEAQEDKGVEQKMHVHPPPHDEGAEEGGGVECPQRSYFYIVLERSVFVFVLI